MAQPLVLPVAEYAPDMPDYPGVASSLIKNVVPKTAVSYGPMLSPAPVYDALDARCQGATAFRDNDGNTYVYAGTGHNLYQVAAGSSGWTNISKASGVYSLAPDDQWQFIFFNGDVLAGNRNDNIQRLSINDGGTFVDLTGAPPRGRFMAVIKNAFVAVGDTWDSENGYLRQRIRWCAAGDHTNWPTPGTNDAATYQAGAVDLLGPAGWVMGFATDLINADAIIFQEYGVRRMTYHGPPDIFTMLPVENIRGCLCPYSIVSTGGVCYYWGTDGLYKFDGAESLGIGANRVDKTVYAELSQGNINRVFGTSDPANKLIFWAYPSTQAVTGIPDRLLVYNTVLDRFSLCEITCETIVRLLSIGYTLDQLWTVFGWHVDEIPAPLSSSVWLGGRVQLALFDSAHKLNYLTGSSLEATVETKELNPVPGGRALVRGCRPLIDTTSVTVSMGRRDLTAASVSYEQAYALNQLGVCPARTSGRYLRAKTVIAAGASWNDISGVELDMTAQGVR